MSLHDMGSGLERLVPKPWEILVAVATIIGIGVAIGKWVL
jgi:hypothetical protein